MNFRVLIETPAAAEIGAAYDWIARRAPLNAARWYNGLMTTLETLRRFPSRCATAPESRHFKEEIKQLLYGRGRHRYRALFVIRADTVRVLHFRHWARTAMRVGSIQLPDDA